MSQPCLSAQQQLIQLMGQPKLITAKQLIRATPAIAMASCSLSGDRKLLWWPDRCPKLQGMASETCLLPLQHH